METIRMCTDQSLCPSMHIIPYEPVINNDWDFLECTLVWLVLCMTHVKASRFEAAYENKSTTAITS